ncbi:ribosomal large subunit pseudouridine synthase A [Actinobacillus ureae]|nr:ribosomal large subunit pseudouridine synthase A [Actinobacillus ureae]
MVRNMALIEYHPPLEPFLTEVYRDNHILVINKPSGLLSVPGNRPEYYDSAMTRVQQKYGFYRTCTPLGYGNQRHSVICTQ